VITEATAKTHVSRILQKLDLRDRVQAMILRLRDRPRRARLCAPEGPAREAHHFRVAAVNGVASPTQTNDGAFMEPRGCKRQPGTAKVYADSRAAARLITWVQTCPLSSSTPLHEAIDADPHPTDRGRGHRGLIGVGRGNTEGTQARARAGTGGH
jgi:hypothetical protein